MKNNKYGVNVIYKTNREDYPEIHSTVYFDRADYNYCEEFFNHPLTGSECGNILQIFNGWSEQIVEENSKWDLLTNAITDEYNKDQISGFYSHDSENPPTQWTFVFDLEGNLVDKIEE